jgi:hypothetical protein
MAEEESEFQLEAFKQQLKSLFVSSSSEEYGLQSKLYCVRFCKVKQCIGITPFWGERERKRLVFPSAD